MADRIRILRGTEGMWLVDEQDGRILELGEIGYITDTNELVIGDGVTTFSDLKRFNAINREFVETHIDTMGNLILDGGGVNG